MTLNQRSCFRASTVPGRSLRHTNHAKAQEALRVESRANSDGKYIRGVSAVFYDPSDEGTEYWLWSDTVERIHPDAFNRALAEQHDARGNYNHRDVLGRVSAGTCRLSKTSIGLEYEIDFDPKDPDHLRCGAKIDRGDVTGSSFWFYPTRTVWEEEKRGDDWVYIRNIMDLDLYDVGPVDWPAYEATSATRSSEGQNGEGVPPEYAALMAERVKQLGAARAPSALAVEARLKTLNGAHWMPTAEEYPPKS